MAGCHSLNSKRGNGGISLYLDSRHYRSVWNPPCPSSSPAQSSSHRTSIWIHTASAAWPRTLICGIFRGRPGSYLPAPKSAVRCWLQGRVALTRLKAVWCTKTGLKGSAVRVQIMSVLGVGVDVKVMGKLMLKDMVLVLVHCSCYLHGFKEEHHKQWK